MMLSLITYSPSSSLFSYTTSLLSVPLFAGNTYLKQEISKSKYFLIWNWIRSSKSCSSINSPMICYDVWFERGQPLPPGRPSNRLTFTMTPTWLRLKKGEDKGQHFIDWLIYWNVLYENHHMHLCTNKRFSTQIICVANSYLSKMQFAKIQTVASKKSPF